MVDRGGSVGRFGRWTIRGHLGSGGMGVVYEAVDPSGVRAALKVISPVFASDPAFCSRFRREIELTRRISGQRIAAVLDADPGGDPPWLATEFVDGPTLSEAVARGGPLRDPALTAFAVALLQALADIHAAGVVHRDLKPTNVILTASTPRVIDFGIASAAEATSITTTGALVGSAGWMSPEQARGDPVGPPSDLFTWATVVAFAATGEPPFGTGRPEALAYRIVHTSPDLRHVPASVRTHLASAFDQDPDGRPTVEALVAALAGDDPQTTVAGGWSTVPPTVVEPPERSAATQVGGDPARSSAAGPARGWAWIGAVLAVVAVAAGLIWLAVDRDPPATGAEDVEAQPTPSAPAPTAVPTTSPETTTTTPPSPDDPRSYFTTDGTEPALAPDCLGLLGVCWGDSAGRVRDVLGEEDERDVFFGEDGLPVTVREWQIGNASISLTFDLFDSVTDLDVRPAGDARDLRLLTPPDDTLGSLDLDFAATRMGDVRTELGEPEVSTAEGEGVTTYSYGYPIGGEGFLHLQFTHTATRDDDPGSGRALDSRPVDGVEIIDTSFLGF